MYEQDDTNTIVTRINVCQDIYMYFHEMKKIFILRFSLIHKQKYLTFNPICFNFFALAHLISEPDYCALGTFLKKT